MRVFNIDMYLSGRKLYGDDFDLDQIREWYEDEHEAYAQLVNSSPGAYAYCYHALNQRHGFRHLRAGRFREVLGFGSAYGDELMPIARRIDRLTIVDPSDQFARGSVHGIPTEYVKPTLSGELPFSSGQFDLVTCFGVLHHIPNVSDVVAELRRCLSADGVALIREPIISMGDWTRKRPGLTKRERGLPDAVFAQLLARVGFRVRTKTYCMFPVIPRLWAMFGGVAYNSGFATRLDSWLSRSLAWNVRYHATRPIHKFRPTVAFYVLSR